MEYFVGVKSCLEGHTTVQVFKRNGETVGEFFEGSDKIPQNIRICDTLSEFYSVMIMYDFLY